MANTRAHGGTTGRFAGRTTSRSAGEVSPSARGKHGRRGGPRNAPRRTSRRGMRAVPAVGEGAATALRNEAELRVAVIEALRVALSTRGYGAASYDVVAELAGVQPAEIRELFGSKSELVLEALGLPPTPHGAACLALLSGRDIVTRYLEFWETGDNATILLGVLGAAATDQRVVRDFEGYITRALVRPLSTALDRADAYPRVRLLISYLSGLAVSRYLLREEPLASADHETVADWMGPSIDGFLHGQLGAA